MSVKGATVSGEAPVATLMDQYPALVLLVDDQKMIGEAVRRALAGVPNMDFHFCADPAEAVSVARQLKPSIILQDLVMPGMDGIDLVRAYRADPITREIPIVVLSTKEEATVKGEAFAAGANDYMVKLPDRIEMIARIEYHSRSYLNQVQRNDAFRLLRESEKRLSERNFEIQVVNEGLAREVKFRKQKSLEQSALANFSIAALSAENFEAVQHLAIATASDVLRMETGSCTEIDVAADRVHTVSEPGKVFNHPAPKKLSEYPKDHLLRYVLRTKAPVHIVDTETERRFSLSPRSLDFNARSALVLPVPFTEGSTGILTMVAVDTRAFSRDDEEFLQSLANILAVFHAREKTLERLRLRDRALEAITQGVTISDIRLDQNPVIYTNPAFSGMTGYNLDEIIGRSALSFFEPDIAEDLGQRLAATWREKQTLREDIKALRKDNSTYLAHLQSSPIPEPNGGIAYYVTVHEDVTDTRKRDALLLEAQRVESVGQLTGGIAHDFNNLLMAIKSNAEDMKEDLKESPLMLRQTEIILRAADRGAGLVEQLMAFARKQELSPVLSNIANLLAEYGPFLRSALPENVAIDSTCAKDLPSVNVDPERLRTALLNIALNSRDAMPNGGLFTIEAELKTLDGEYTSENIDVDPGTYIVIAVTDTGTGMPKDVAKRAFVPFFTTKEVGKGTGLGLSMVHGFVKQSGGHAKLYSEVGHGTVLKIYLPVADDGETEAALPADDGADYTGISILLVEDDDLVRESVKNKLVRLDYAVTAVSSAEAALSTLESNPHYHMVYTDVIMPGTMTGGDLAFEVQKRWPHIRILMSSGYTEKTALGKVKMPTGVRLLSKPYSNADLAAAIRAVLSGIGKPENDDAAG